MVYKCYSAVHFFYHRVLWALGLFFDPFQRKLDTNVANVMGTVQSSVMPSCEAMPSAMATPVNNANGSFVLLSLFLSEWLQGKVQGKPSHVKHEIVLLLLIPFLFSSSCSSINMMVELHLVSAAAIDEDVVDWLSSSPSSSSKSNMSCRASSSSSEGWYTSCAWCEWWCCWLNPSKSPRSICSSKSVSLIASDLRLDSISICDCLLGSLWMGGGVSKLRILLWLLVLLLPLLNMVWSCNS